MKFIAGDFRKLQLSLFTCLAMIGVGVAGIYLAKRTTDSAIGERASAQAQGNDIDGKLRRVRSEENEIKEKSALFQKLQNRGVIGEEQRLEWVELLKDIREKRRLIDLRYEIEPQRPLDTPPGNDFSFNASLMRVELKLLHEEDLTRFLDDLRQQARALIKVRSCSVTRQTHAQSSGAGSANLLAECRIDWITLRTAQKK